MFGGIQTWPRPFFPVMEQNPGDARAGANRVDLDGAAGARRRRLIDLEEVN